MLSGTVALWAGDQRFDVPITTYAVATRLARPHQPGNLDYRAVSAPDLCYGGAVVTALDVRARDPARCEPWYRARAVPNAHCSFHGRPDSAANGLMKHRFVMRARAATPTDRQPAAGDGPVDVHHAVRGRGVTVTQPTEPGRRHPPR